MQPARRRNQGVNAPVEETGQSGGSTAPTRKPAQPWYDVAREAAQILVSALALYASIKAFAEKMKKRHEEV